MIHVYNIYSDSEICVVVLFRTYLDSWLPDVHQQMFFRRWTISLADFRGKIQSGSRVFNCETNCNSLVFEVGLSRNDPDASP